MAFEIVGRVIEVAPVQQVNDKFRKREFVVEYSEQGSGGKEFVDYIKFQCIQDRCELIDETFNGKVVKVSFNIKGNKWERDGKVNYFTNLDAWRIEVTSGEQKSDQFVPPPLLEDDNGTDGEFEDLPF